MNARGLALAVLIALGACDASPSPSGTSAGAEIAAGDKLKITQFWALYRQAQEQAKHGDVELAIASYRQVLAIRPDHEDSNYNLGNLLAQRGEFALALESFDALFRSNPLSPRGHYQVAAILASWEPGAPVDFARARQHIEQGMHINPEESGPYYDLGHLALLCGESDRARSDLELAVRRNPKGFQASADLAWLARSNGDLKGAAALYLRAIEQCRGDLPIAGVLGEGDTEATKQRFHPESDRSIAIFAGLVRTSLEIGSYAEQVPAPLRLPHGFTLETPASGAWFAPPVDVHGAGGGAVAVDIDHDGDLDIVLAGWHDGATLLEHDGARWREAALVVQGGSAPRAWDVIRLSGDEQPLLLYFVSGGWGGRENRLLRARGDATFEDVTAAAGLAGARATMCACAVDVNGDRELDLVEGLATRHDAVRVWLRHADRFEAASNAAIDGPITHLAAHGASVLAARGRAGLALLAIDPSGSVRDEARTRGLTGASGWVAAWVDIDGDGCDDVFAPGMPSYEQALRNWLRLPAEAPRVVFYRGSREGTFSAANDALLQLGSVVDVAVLQNGRRSALYLACGGLRLDHEEMDVVLCMAADGKVALHAPWAPEHLPGKTVHVLAAELTGDQLPDLYLARSGFYPSDRRADRILRGLAHGETAQR